LRQADAGNLREYAIEQRAYMASDRSTIDGSGTAAVR
jgi:hypothetical protein